VIPGGNGTARGEIRRRLNSLGKTRKKRRAEDERLVDDIKEALAAARLAGIPMEEAAKRLGLNRTTLYQVYLDPSDRREPKPA
jgi:DNA invertase Pin-like site-specific DNA recombinase